MSASQDNRPTVVAFYKLGERIATMRLDAAGVPRLDPGGSIREEFLASVNVIEPGNPPAPVRPEDGERYLRALPYAFRSPYLSAGIVGGGR